MEFFVNVSRFPNLNGSFPYVLECLVGGGQWIIDLSPLSMRRECRERFPRHRGLTIPTCIPTCRDARAVMPAGISN